MTKTSDLRIFTSLVTKIQVNAKNIFGEEPVCYWHGDTDCGRCKQISGGIQWVPTWHYKLRKILEDD